MRACIVGRAGKHARRHRNIVSLIPSVGKRYDMQTRPVLNQTHPVSLHLQVLNMQSTDVRKHWNQTSNLFGYFPRSRDGAQIACCHQHRPVDGIKAQL